MNAEKSNPMCIIPARGGSKRLPRKNLALLDGKSLLGWTIDAATQSGIFDTIWVSSEDPEVQSAAVDLGAKVLPRPAEFAGDRTTLVQLCEHIAREAATLHPAYDAMYVLLPTSPFRKAETIRNAWSAFLASNAETLLSVIPVPHPPQWSMSDEGGWLGSMFPDQYELPRMALKTAWRHEGGHAIAWLRAFREKPAFLGPRTLAFPVPLGESLDIDEPEDLEWAKYVLQRKTP